MKKFLLISVILSLAFNAKAQQAQTDSDLSLDFMYNNVWYTIIDDEAKTCKTKDGTVVDTGGSPKYIFSYGNTLSGDVQIPAKVQKDGVDYTVVAVGNVAFSGISSISLPPTVTAIGNNAFINCTLLTSIDIPQSVQTIGSGAFSVCTSLQKVTLPSGLTVIPASCFAQCSALKSIEFPAALTSIGENAFARSGITDVRLPEGFSELGKSAFESCRSLESVTFPSTLTAISEFAFSSCTFKQLELPATITQIGSYAFYNCDYLQNVYCYAPMPPAISGTSFGAIDLSSTTLNVYKTAMNAFRKNSLWNIFGNYQVIPVAATGITLDKTSVTVYEGLSTQLTATLIPLDATDQIVWSATGNATVDSNGKVLSSTTGSALITATAGSHSATCDVTVLKNSSARITINPISTDLIVGNDYSLTAQIFPVTITSPVEWTSSNPEVACVQSSGNNSATLTAVFPGGAVITATCGDIVGKYAITVNPVEAQSVSITPVTQSLVPGQTISLEASVLPENTTFPQLTWASNDETVATVSDGIVTAIKPGNVTITATCGLVTDAVEITVDPILPQQVNINENQITLRASQSHQLVAEVLPENTTDPTVVWSTANPAVAVVAVDGTVTAVAVGNTNITATCGSVSATCEVKVEATPADQVTISMTATTMRVGQTQQLLATVPELTTDKTITWNSSNPDCATVSENGLVTAIQIGTAEIRATCGDVFAVCSVTVEPTPAEQIILSESNISVNVGDDYTLTAQVLPQDTTDPTVTWSSDNENVASVDNGIVTGKEPGSTVIFASCGNITAICNVTVLYPATDVTLNFSEITLTVGDMDDLIPTVTPQNTTDLPVWTSSDPSVASVNDHGIIDAIAPGEALITVQFGDVSATCKVVVLAKVITSLSVTPQNLTLDDGAESTLTVQFEPADIDPLLQWSVDDNSVIRIVPGLNAQTVTVIALQPGTATVTVTANDGSALSAACEITVIEVPVKALSLGLAQATLDVQDLPLELSVTYDPEGATLPQLNWTSSDNDVAEVIPVGDLGAQVRGIAAGNATITVALVKDAGTYDTCLITVTDKSSIGDILEDIEFDGPVDVYDIKGRLIHKQVDIQNIDDLTPGIYIFRSGETSRKILVK